MSNQTLVRSFTIYPPAGFEILNLRKRFQQEYGLTYLLISHDPKTVYNLANREVVMYSEKVVEEIDDLERFNSMCHPYTQLLLGMGIVQNMFAVECFSLSIYISCEIRGRQEYDYQKKRRLSIFGRIVRQQAGLLSSVAPLYELFYSE